MCTRPSLPPLSSSFRWLLMKFLFKNHAPTSTAASAAAAASAKKVAGSGNMSGPGRQAGRQAGRALAWKGRGRRGETEICPLGTTSPHHHFNSYFCSGAQGPRSSSPSSFFAMLICCVGEKRVMVVDLGA